MMQRTLVTISALLVLACGPTITGSSTEEGGSPESTDQTGTLDQGGTTASTADPDGSTSSTGSTGSASSSDDTGPLGELAPPGSAITSAPCNEDGTLRLTVEAYLESQVIECTPPLDIPPSSYVLVHIDAWDQFSMVFEVGPDGPAQVSHGTSEMTGTLTLGTWAPGHPSVLTLDVAGESGVLQGTIELETCTVELGSCMPPPPDGG